MDPTLAAVLAAAIAAGVAIWSTRRSLRPWTSRSVIFTPQKRGGWIAWEAQEGNPEQLLGKLWNIGRGPAIIGDMRLVVDGSDVVAPAGGEIPLAADSDTRHSPQLLPGTPRGGRGKLRIHYRSASGRGYVTECDAVLHSVHGTLCKDFKRKQEPRPGREFTH